MPMELIIWRLRSATQIIEPNAPFLLFDTLSHNKLGDLSLLFNALPPW